MKLIDLEEHFVTPDVLTAWKALDARHQDVALKHSDQGEIGEKLCNLAERRLADMDETGLDMQVLSLTAGPTESRARRGGRFANTTNDLIASTVALHPDRFQGSPPWRRPIPKPPQWNCGAP